MSDDPSIDPMLRVLVDVCNNAPLQVGVSVLLGGAWVSGTLISPRMFTTEMADEMSRRDADVLRPFFDQAGRLWFPAEVETDKADADAARTDDEDDDDDRKLPLHLHLRHARVFNGGSEPVPVDGFYMRIRLEHVAAWTLGVLGPPGYKAPDAPRPVGD